MIPWIERPERHGTGPSRLSKACPGKGLLNSEEREYQTEVTLEVIWFTAKSLNPWTDQRDQLQFMVFQNLNSVH